MTYVWSNQAGKVEHNTPEGPLHSTAQDLNCSAMCTSIAETTDKVLGVVSGNVTGGVSKQVGGALVKANTISEVIGTVSDIKEKIEVPE
ncbi:hypothetical protein [Pseudoalteromonas phenolica]|uniref:Uncharacterized protein n=1 Tax=Pseudoalteromonas phenolica TaxID=161398 RepID=A0A0S2K850_9GAMM|nr:hypothetical protein [Pseudoalteromonas phenolica]ALO44481.1 hypothetical protein PP2015_4013 [Pseudoalteromonas phenolica]MBE0357504.1 hypothetical protein [Pseudoalteromonas phenolica O-BC30]RXE98487.1 hypothetical protein D9981_10540 [Pseudoalteromonas phenolica O-BC30]